MAPRKTRFTVSAALLAAVLLSASLPTAEGTVTAAVQSSNGTQLDWVGFLLQNNSATLGWSFYANEDLEVTSLGLYLSRAEGFLHSHHVGIWSSGGSLLADAVLPAGVSSTTGDYLYEAITPLSLEAGSTYVIGAYFPAVTSGGDTMVYQAQQSFAPEINFVASLQTLAEYGEGTLTLPTGSTGLPDGIFGPNFQFTTSIPEPTTATMCAAVGLIFAFKRRRRH